VIKNYFVALPSLLSITTVMVLQHRHDFVDFIPITHLDVVYLPAILAMH